MSGPSNDADDPGPSCEPLNTYERDDVAAVTAPVEDPADAPVPHVHYDAAGDVIAEH